MIFLNPNTTITNLTELNDSYVFIWPKLTILLLKPYSVSVWHGQKKRLGLATCFNWRSTRDMDYPQCVKAWAHNRLKCKRYLHRLPPIGWRIWRGGTAAAIVPAITISRAAIYATRGPRGGFGNCRRNPGTEL